jgi:MFS family permease
MTNSTMTNFDGPPAPPRQRRGVLRALGHANYRLFFIGQGVSLLGTWMQQTAMAWFVYRLTNDRFLLGLNTFASQIPSLLLLPVAGVLLDRWNLLNLVRITQVLAMLQAFILAALVLLGWVEIWHVLVLAFGLGCVNAFDLPARQALLPELLDSKDDLSNAIALNSSLFNAARLIGPALAGQMVKLVPDGEGWCFLLNGLSFLAVLASLAWVRIVHTRPPQQPLLEGLRDGLKYALGHRPIRAVLLMVAIVGFAGMPYTVLVPIYARDVLHGEADMYGLLLTASGLGALAGAVYLAGRPNIRGSASRIVVAGSIAAVALALFALTDNVLLSLGLILLVGMNMMLAVVSCNTIVQSIIPDDKRGRVMSLYSLSFLGFTPFGCLIAGAVAENVNPELAMQLCAFGSAVGIALFVPAVPAIRAAIRAHLASQKQQAVAPAAQEVAEAGSGVRDLSGEVHRVGPL